MSVRAIVATLRSAIQNRSEAERRERMATFLRFISARRQWKLLPRIVAALAHLEAEAGAPPLAIVVPKPLPDLPEGAEVALSPGLLGGAQVRSGDMLVDTALSTQLTRLSKTLKS